MTSTTDERCEQLSEHELRRLYDEEEAERFLHFFSNKYVTEVQLLDNPIEGKDGPTDAEKPNQESMGVPNSTDISMSETIALHIVVPLLPLANSAQPPPPPFTISRCCLTVQRLYLALEPLYYPIIINLISLATWINKGRSMRYCVIFWMLWWHDLLLPSLVLCILYSLLRRRIFAHPTYAELLERRRQIDKAAEIGDDLSVRLTKSTYSLQDPWKLYKLCLSLVKRKGDTSKSNAGDSCPNLGEGSTVPDENEDNKRTEEAASVALHVLNQIADLHERVQNIFIWRQPASSSLYGALLVLAFLLTFFTPARYLSKLVYFGCGFAFWHVIPVIAVLPPGSLSRIPPPFVNVPTNAEFAMQLISRRVADGHSVTPQRPAKVHSRSPSETLQSQDQDNSKIGTRSLPQDRIEWSKWGNRIAAGKSWATSSQQRQPVNENMETESQLTTDSAGNGESHAYPAQCRTTTGLLTVTSNSIYFTPALSTSAKIEIPFPALRNVKRSDMLKVRGLKIRWMDATTNSEQEEHFVWVGGRDELFARLIGYGRGRWLKPLPEYLRDVLYAIYIPRPLYFDPSSQQMFFTPELLARRDHGFGLLWLAATLGSKSIFKKLPKRSVLTADIAQLCNLIVQPNEPLALRLSSNLMMGVVRIYKVKQETFFSDVSTCVSSLKKAVYELRALGEEQLQMGQPTIRSAAVTLAPDPKNAFMMEFDMLVADWDEYLDLDGPANTRVAIDDDADYNPSMVKKAKIKARRRPVTDVGNASAHTLVEHHEHVLSASFDLSSFNVQNQGLLVEPSSNNEFFDFFPMLDEPAIGDVLGDELARELGWETPPPPIELGNFAPVTDVADLPMNPEENINPPMQNFDDHQSVNEHMNTAHFPADALVSPMNHQQFEPAPGGGFSPSRASQMHDKAQLIQPLNDITNTEMLSKSNIAIRPRPKKNSVLLDQRTELTDDELKSARTQYMRAQAMQRRELADKRVEKQSNRLVETRIFGAPAGVTAPTLIDFWQGTVKARVNARLSKTSQQDLERPRKRRKTEGNLKTRTEDLGTLPMGLLESEGPNIDGFPLPEAVGPYRSSEEPGQGRYVSRPPSALGSNFGLENEIGLHESLLQSQQSFMFPWDNAGPTSSAEGAPFGISSDNGVLVEQADVRLRNSSRSRRESPISPNRLDNNLAGDVFSPAPVGRGSQGLAEDYQFDVKSSARNSVVAETKQIGRQTQAVEKNSLNFLEYAKMQAQILPNPDLELSFDTIVPELTSSKHVAAAAFYHCLVLGTKDLLRFRQTEPHGPIAIAITKRV